MLQIDLRSRIPIYEQLMEKIKQLIMEDVMKADEQLPSVRTLAKELTINPNTIQKAYKELEREGYIYTVQGRGNFVQPMREEDHREALVKLKKEIKKLVSEALYLGMDKDELQAMIKETDQLIKGENSND